MIRVSVFFRNFETKEEWLEFGKKLFSQKEVVKYSIFKRFTPECNMSYEDIINDCYNRHTEYFIGTQLGILSTKSTKTLKLLNEIIKENHWEDNYVIWYRSDKLHMGLDELLETYSN